MDEPSRCCDVCASSKRTLAILLGILIAAHSFAGDAVFSDDGQRIYAIGNVENQRTLREINLSDQTVRTVPLNQLPPEHSLCGIARSDGNEISCVTEKSLWTFDPQTGRLTKICEAPKGGRFWRVAYDPKSRAIFVTASGQGGPLLMLKGGHELVPIFVRRHDRITSPVFNADGELFYSEGGDLWSGEIESEEGRYWLTASRFVPLAYLETTNGTPSEMGVSDVALTRDAIYVQLFRMGGSGWGLLLQLPRPPKAGEQAASSMGETAVNELNRYKELLQGLKSLGNADRPAYLCASPDESRVYYTNDDKDYLITNGQTQELHLRTTTSAPPPATVPNQTAPAGSPAASAANSATTGRAFTQEEGSAFAETEINAVSSRDLDALVSFYADHVDYLDKGLVSRDVVRHDFQQYFTRWATAKWMLAGPVKVTPLGTSKYQLAFSIAFDVASSDTNRRVTGTAEETQIVMVGSDGAAKIVSSREKVSNSHKAGENPESTPRKRPSRLIEGERVYEGKPVYPPRP